MTTLYLRYPVFLYVMTIFKVKPNFTFMFTFTLARLSLHYDYLQPKGQSYSYVYFHVTNFILMLGQQSSEKRKERYLYLFGKTLGESLCTHLYIVIQKWTSLVM